MRFFTRENEVGHNNNNNNIMDARYLISETDSTSIAGGGGE
jgi:hypothetical protein